MPLLVVPLLVVPLLVVPLLVVPLLVVTLVASWCDVGRAYMSQIFEVYDDNTVGVVEFHYSVAHLDVEIMNLALLVLEITCRNQDMVFFVKIDARTVLLR